MMVIAVIGLVVNLIVAFVLGGHAHEHEHGEDEPEHEDLNTRSAYLHVLGDAVSSIGVIVAGAVLWFTGWTWIGPLMSVFIGALIVLSSWRVLRSAVHILIEGVPEHLSLAIIGQKLSETPGVLDVHDLHVWSLCSGHIALSAHVVLDDQGLSATTDRMRTLKKRLNGFGIEHTTIQFECAACGQGRSVALKVMPATGDSSLAPGVAPT